MTLSDYAQIANITIAVLTLIGVVGSLYLSRRALQEVQSDRVHRQRPHLAFERGGFRYPIRFVAAGKTIPGVDPKAVAKLFPALPDSAQSVRLADPKDEVLRVGRLKNYGLGPALSVRVIWIAKCVWIGSDRFNIDGEKSEEPAYSVGLNTMPCSPAHLLPEEGGGLTRIPTFIEKDIERKVTRASGVLCISAKDVFGTHLNFLQEFEVFTGYSDASPYFHVTFGDIVDSDEEASSGLALPPNSALQRTGTNKVLGRGRPSEKRTRALPRPRADESAAGR